MTIFYDAQLRRYLTQVGAVFQGWKWKNGNGDFREVPVKMASSDRQVSHILNNNSENTTLSCPSISFYVRDLALDHDRRQDASHVSTLTVVEREFRDGAYTSDRGITSTIERLMPVPYKLTVQVDVWTSNTDQKHQLLEQFMTLFNPELTLQTSVNPVDWTALTYMKLTDLTYSSRTVPVGTDQDIDVASLTFELPIFINPPAKVKRSVLIEQVMVNVGAAASRPCAGEGEFLGDLWSRAIYTPRDHRIAMNGGVATLLTSSGKEVGDDGQLLSWEWLFERMGTIRPGISQLRLKTTDDMDDHASDIVGTIGRHPEANKLFWTPDIDTLPSDTLPAVEAIIDPSVTGPGTGLIVHTGVRYLLAGDIGSAVWGVDAREGSIIQHTGVEWVVSFSGGATPQYVTNRRTGKQLRWTGREWIIAVDGVYNPGYWRLFI